MFRPGFEEDLIGGMYPQAGSGRPRAMRRFAEYYRVYPIVMAPGAERNELNYGGKIFLPPSALDKLMRLHISYPMMFELTNAEKEKKAHAGVLEFTAEEGKTYLPFWLMQQLQLEPGDLVEIKSTDLPTGSFLKVQAQSTDFLEISDPKAVLENVLRAYACLTAGDVFVFEYNEQTFEMAVLEVKPDLESHAIVVLETDLEVDFATPVGYEEPKKVSGTSTPMSNAGLPVGGMVHTQGTMAQAINYASIAPQSKAVADGARAVSSNFLTQGQRLSAKKGSRTQTPQASTPVAGASTNPPAPAPRKTNGPQPLRLPPGKLFFGYEVKPVKKDGDQPPAEPSRFQGAGQTLSGRKRKEEAKSEGTATPPVVTKPSAGRTLRDTPK